MTMRTNVYHYKLIMDIFIDWTDIFQYLRYNSNNKKLTVAPCSNHTLEQLLNGYHRVFCTSMDCIRPKGVSCYTSLIKNVTVTKHRRLMGSVLLVVNVESQL